MSTVLSVKVFVHLIRSSPQFTRRDRWTATIARRSAGVLIKPKTLWHSYAIQLVSALCASVPPAAFRRARARLIGRAGAIHHLSALVPGLSTFVPKRVGALEVRTISSTSIRVRPVSGSAGLAINLSKRS